MLLAVMHLTKIAFSNLSNVKTASDFRLEVPAIYYLDWHLLGLLFKLLVSLSGRLSSKHIPAFDLSPP